MTPGIYSASELGQSHTRTNKVFLIAGGACGSRFIQDLRNEIRNSGWDCEIVAEEASDRDEIHIVIWEMLDRFDQDTPTNSGGSRGQRLIRQITAEEWLAQ